MPDSLPTPSAAKAFVEGRMLSATMIPDVQAFHQVIRALAWQAMKGYPTTPDCTRITRAVAMILADKVFPDTSHVRSQGHGYAVYTVGKTCQCPDFTHQKAPEGRCKHRWAATLYRRAQRILPHLWVATYTAPGVFQEGYAWEDKGCTWFIDEHGVIPIQVDPWEVKKHSKVLAAGSTVLQG